MIICCGEEAMKKLFRFLFWAAVIGGIIYVVRKMLAPAQPVPAGSGSGVLPSEPIKSLDEAPLGGQISEELLRILVCPEDKGPLELVDEGKFLLNPRNGYKYPIRNGIPVMLIEEGKKYQDKSLTRSNGTGGKAEKADKPAAEKVEKPAVEKADKPAAGKADKPAADKSGEKGGKEKEDKKNS
jgi:uncharacterized protein